MITQQNKYQQSQYERYLFHFLNLSFIYANLDIINNKLKIKN